MRFIKNILFDIYNGIIRHYMLYIFPAVITGIASADCVRRINNYIINWGEPGDGACFGDVWCYLYGGMEEFVPAPGNAFRFPAVWTMVFGICSILVLTYTTKDMIGTGAQVMVAGGSRGTWWFSKVIWNILSTLVYHGVVMAVSMAVCGIMQIPISNGINMGMQISINDIENGEAFKTVHAIPIILFVMPVLVSVAMNLLQQTLTLFISPGYAFICTGVLMMASAYILSPLMPYNYGMALRYRDIAEGGVAYKWGLVLAGVIAVAAVITGYIRFLRYDIIRKEDN